MCEVMTVGLQDMLSVAVASAHVAVYLRRFQTIRAR